MTLDLIGSTEAAQVAGITPPTFRTLAAKHTTKNPVPTPAINGARGQRTMWHRSDIESWAATRDRTRGAAPTRKTD